MRFMPIGLAKEGMCVARTLRNAKGTVLVSENSTLTNAMITKLKSLGFQGLYVEDDLSSEIEIEDMISEQVRYESRFYIRNKDIDGCKRISKKIVSDILDRGFISLDLIDLREMDDVTYSHSVNVAVYSCILGMGMGYDKQALTDLVLAGLLHDIGKLFIPKEILNKTGRLSAEEYRLIQSHALKSYQFIENRTDISDQIKDAVLHHHENEDGSGYPDHLMGSEQSEYTKILHLADVYDALISRRPYKPCYSPVEAAEYLMGASSLMFEPKVVSTFLTYVPLFPKGSFVQLSDGRRGIVSENADEHNLRPVLRLMDHTTLDLLLSENLDITILSLEPEGDAMIVKSEMERTEMVSKAERKRLLIVDDMISNLNMLRDILAENYEITLVKSGRQALSYLEKKKKPDLILMDIMMPELDGIETVDRIRKRYGKIPVLYVTVKNDMETLLRCRKMDMAGYILKPYQPTFVRSEVKRILERRSEAV